MSTSTDWDAIVIGAGLAGLSCAAHLAKAGKKVVVLEQQSRPGGYWTSFARQGHVFDIATHSISDPQAINRMLRGLGAEPVDFVHLENLGRFVGPPVSRGSAGKAGSPQRPEAAAATPAWDILVGPDIEAFKASVRRSFPTVPVDALEKLVKTAVRVSRSLDSPPFFSPELHRLGRTPATAFFQKLFPAGDLAGLRTALCCMAPRPGLTALSSLGTLGTGLRGRLYAPRGGSRALSEAFAVAAERNGAQIRYDTRVLSILAEGRNIHGVILDDRTRLLAPRVVSAVDAKQTFYRLLHRDLIPDSYRRVLDNEAVSQPYAVISALVTLEPAVYGFDGTEVFVCPSAGDSASLLSPDPADCPFRLVFPRYAELGADRSLRALQIVVPSTYSWHDHWATRPVPERGAEYRALKEEWSRTILGRAQEYLPRLASHVELVDVATPISMYRHTLNAEGAPFGWRLDSRRRWKQRVPFLDGLYQAGHWVTGPGALSVTRSGKAAAELVLRGSPSPECKAKPAAPPLGAAPHIDLAR